MTKNHLAIRLNCLIFLTFSVLGFALNTHAVPRVNIGFVLDGPSILNDRVLNSYKNEITAMTEGEFEVEFPQNKTIIANWTVSSLKSSINKLLADPQVDILITRGIIGSTVVSKRKNLQIPVIAPWLIDSDLLGLPIDARRARGVRNLTYLIFTGYDQRRSRHW